MASRKPGGDAFTLRIKSTGRGCRRMQLSDKYGFPRGTAKEHKKLHFGFQTGDIVKAVVTKGKKIGTYIGRVAVRKKGSFNVTFPAHIVHGSRISRSVSY